MCSAWPGAAVAQSTVAGTVRDATGAVLPGVTVEAASPVLIEKVRSAVTDGQGQFQIIDLRPGTYAITFTLTGFTVVRREGIDLPANFTAQVNVELTVATLAETVTVSGQSPVVDVRNALVQNVMSRELLDALPTGRSYQSVAQTAPSIQVNRPDIAGTEAFFSTNLRVHGSLTRDQAIHLDGMDTTSGEGDGRFQGFYRDDGDNEAVVYTTSAIPAEVSKGGVRINMIGREGGNVLKGSFFAAEAPGRWQADNIDNDLRKRGLPTARDVRRIFDYNFTLGGPLQRDKHWFFTSWRYWGVYNYAAGAFRPDGSRSPDDALHATGSVRTTSQLSQRNKLMFYYSRMFKRTLYERFIGPNRPEIASSRHTTPIIYSSQAKWTSPLTNRVFLEGGFSITYTHPKIWPQPEVALDPNVIPKQDLVLGTFSGAYAQRSDLYKGSGNISGALSYVTGSHQIKTGFQLRQARSRNTLSITGDDDLIQEYRSGVPSSVTVFATPADQRVKLNADMGLYAQDSWTMHRLTLNAGLRFEYFNGTVLARDLPAGRFVPARHFDEISDVPNWKDITPRLGVVYDVFGTGKTAIKGSISKYMWGESVAFTERHSPHQTGGANGSDRRTWNDLNRDDIAQDNEIGPASNRNFGLAPALRPDPNIKRPYQVEYNVTLQHELVPRVSVTGAWFRRQYYRLFQTIDRAVSFSDYSPVTVTSPLSGEAITIYNLRPDKLGLVDQLETNSDNNLRKYNGFDVSLDARLGRRTTVFGGLAVGKQVERTCDVPDPNLLRFCDQTSFIPYQTVAKLSGSHVLPGGIVASASFQSYPGNPVNAQAAGDLQTPEAGLQVQWQVTRAVVPTLTQALITVPLIAPGSKYLERYNQVDIRLGKQFHINRMSLDANVDVFNLLNSNVVMRVIETFGANLDRPQEIPQARLFRVGAHLRF
ncbi:MAG: carboxypeptidase regulatory-like domain-containing protein [Vicinamibacterales bacterium]